MNIQPIQNRTLLTLITHAVTDRELHSLTTSIVSHLNSLSCVVSFKSEREREREGRRERVEEREGGGETGDEREKGKKTNVPKRFQQQLAPKMELSLTGWCHITTENLSSSQNKKSKNDTQFFREKYFLWL